MSLSDQVKELRANVLSLLKITQRPIDQLATAELQGIVDALNGNCVAVATLGRSTLRLLFFSPWWSLIFL